MNSKVKELINVQVNKEFYSAYLYFDFANYYYGKGLDGFGHWFDEQAKEELEHGEKLRSYLYDNGEEVELLPIEKPDKKISSIKDPLVMAAEHERVVTDLIHGIYKAAQQADDFRTMVFMQWFVEEQMEEEKNADALVSRYELFAGDGKGLQSLDKELSSRDED